MNHLWGLCGLLMGITLILIALEENPGCSDRADRRWGENRPDTWRFDATMRIYLLIKPSVFYLPFLLLGTYPALVVCRASDIFFLNYFLPSPE